MDVGEMQRKLSLWAEQDKSQKFFDLYHLLYDKNWLRLAHDYVAQNAGSKTAGCDGISMKIFDENLEENLQRLTEELKSETFEPCPVRRVYIPKGNGKVRPLGIPSIKDRIVQEALRMILEPIYEADFSQYSYGFRPNRCTMDAIRAVTNFTHEHMKFFWVIEGDITSYFDTIKHRKLVKILRQRIKDRKILQLIWKFLKAGVMERRLFKDTEQGTPQGGIISPLLANIYLHELDRYMQCRFTDLKKWEKNKRRRQGQANFVYVRYADDFVVLSNGTRAQVEELKEELHVLLRDKLQLELSEEKTKVTHLNDGFKFLGYWIERSRGHNGMKTKVLIPKEAADKLIDKIRAATDKTTHQDSVNTKILAINRIIGGWCRYYQHSSRATSTFKKVRNKTYWMFPHWLGRKFQISMPEIMRRYRRDNSFATERYCIKQPDEYKTLTYKGRFIKPNPYILKQCVNREELLQDIQWYGWEPRPGMADIRLKALTRDEYLCQICGKSVTDQTAEADHIKPVRRFKRPVDANTLDNIWILCDECHLRKTQFDQQMESRMH